MNSLIAYAIGFLIATIGGAIAIKLLVDYMWQLLYFKYDEDHPDLRRIPSQPTIVGLIERSLYFGAFLEDQAAFIAVWLTLKTVAKSPRWENGENKKKSENKDNKKYSEIPGRAIFQPFIAGNGLSIIFAAGGYGVSKLLVSQGDLSSDLAWIIIGGLVVISIITILIAAIALRKEKGT